MAPLVSVIVPTCDRREMVCDAVDSIRAQSFRDFEIIVVDDGSEDDTADRLLARYGAEIRVLAQPRRGVAAARNLGVERSRGRYAAFLDSDDLWRPRKLEAQVSLIEKRGWRICQTEEIWIRNGMRVNPKKKHRKPSGDIFRASLELCLVSPSAVLMTRELFERVGGFDDAFPVCEDYDLWLRIAVDTPVHLIPAPLVIKRGGHADQLSRSTWGLDRFRVRAIRKLLDGGLQGEKRAWAIDTLTRKAAILAHGARKRLHEAEALSYERLVADFVGEISDQSGYSSVLPGQELSSAD
jgi:glycosyltransferase involved in cell wall biosynthesis